MKKENSIASIKTFKKNIGGKDYVIETGRLAGQTNASVTVKCGDTIILATVVMSKDLKEGLDYFPLTVDYEERFYAAGKIKGSRFIKREGRPTEDAILTGRLVDRAIRPLFDRRIRNEVQVVITVLSIDKENEPEILALLGASVTLMISDIPWGGPVGATRICLVNDKLVINPKCEEKASGKMDLFIAGVSANEINMLEAGAFEVPEQEVLKGIKLASEIIQGFVDWQKEIKKEIGKEKQNLVKIDEKEENVEKDIYKIALNKAEIVFSKPIKLKVELEKELDVLKEEIFKYTEEKYQEEENIKEKTLYVIENVIDSVVHKNALKEDKRPDGRAFNEVRNLQTEIDLLPRVHGSAMFKRGETQALTTVTLGSPSDEQIIDSMTEDSKKRFMHHYNFPPYSVGETGRIGNLGRREIGHSAIAEKALSKIIPSKEDFPYTIRVVNEILSSNGSSSMASVCGGTMALMAAGVPIKKAVAGIAMGLMADTNGNYKILTDIQGPEDHYGDMDCKIAGTAEGLTALQMDVKIKGVTIEILEKTFLQAKEARLHILSKMFETIAESRKQLSIYASVILTFTIDPEKIKDVIGSGGKTINEIIDKTGVAIDIEDDGNVFITSESAESAKKAEEWIKNLVRVVKEGEIFKGIVKRIMDFGAFVEILPKQEGLVHISELAPHRVEKVEDVVHVGDIINVKVKEIDKMGRINLSMKAIK